MCRLYERIHCRFRGCGNKSVRAGKGIRGGIGIMDKKVYEIPELERITLVEEDIITASPGAGHTGDPDCLIDFP